jgi:hypothetical protein
MHIRRDSRFRLSRVIHHRHIQQCSNHRLIHHHHLQQLNPQRHHLGGGDSSEIEIVPE